MDSPPASAQSALPRAGGNHAHAADALAERLRRAERGSAFLSEASALLTGSLDYQATLNQITQLAVPRIADWCAFDLVGANNTIRRVAVHHVDPAKKLLANELANRYPPRADDGHAVSQVLKSGQPILWPEIPDELIEQSAFDTEHARIIRELGLRSGMVVPLKARGRTLGVLTLVTAESGRHFDEADLKLAEDLAARAAQAVDGALLYREAREAVRAREEVSALLDTLLEKAPVGFAFFNNDLRFLRINEALAEINGIPPHEHWGRRVSEVLPNMPASVEEQLARVRDTGQPILNVEVSGGTRGADGSEPRHRDLLVSYYPVRLSSNRTLGIGAVVVDITERKRSERALREAQRRLSQQLTFTRSITDSLAEGLYAMDANGIVTFVNRAAERMLGFTADELLGKDMHQMVHYQHADHSSFPREQCPLLEVTRSGKTVRVEDDTFTRKDGTTFPTSYASAPVLEEGQPVGAVIAFHDITERKAAEEALRESEQRLRMAMDAGRMGSWEWDIQGGRFVWSPMLERMLGLEPGGFGGTFEAFQSFIFPEDREHVVERLSRTLDTQSDHQVEYRVQRTDGTLRWVEARGRLVCDKLGRPQRLVGVCMDISDRKWAEETLRRSNDELEQLVDARTVALQSAAAELRTANTRLEQSNRELQDFASVASHDLQEPLRKIQAFGDRLVTKAGPSLSTEGRDYLQRMQKAAGRMQTLINDLLSFSRVTTRAQPFVPIDLQQIATDVLGDLETAIERNGGRVELVPLPSIEADPTQMRQLLQNLIANALKFRKPNVAPVVRVWGELSDDARQLTIFVSDNGIGFDEKYLDRIFNVFQRLHGRGTYEGTGIGLAVVRKIAERHGGSVTARSKPDEGATFIVALPTRHDEVPPPAIADAGTDARSEERS